MRSVQCSLLWWSSLAGTINGNIYIKFWDLLATSGGGLISHTHWTITIETSQGVAPAKLSSRTACRPPSPLAEKVRSAEWCNILTACNEFLMTLYIDDYDSSYIKSFIQLRNKYPLCYKQTKWLHVLILSSEIHEFRRLHLVRRMPFTSRLFLEQTLRARRWGFVQAISRVHYVIYMEWEETQLCSIGNPPIWLVLPLFSI